MKFLFSHCCQWLSERIDQQLYRFYKGKKGNFGLGLAISKSIIEKHNGKITAENLEPGALFRIVAPLSCEQ
ncbi:MAG: hypothetical protein HPY66_3098 [Firmicutes bacterium]|nr:hypothetical protein [Bacillota bacterium]